jgi:prepilin-type N-terminal cleavage/methylation domain-containing protein
MSGRLRSEGGFTLPELLTTMWIAGVIMLAAFALVDFVMKRTAEAEQRVEATQRGRTGMDMITRQLRSQVCLSDAPPIVEGTADSIQFYTDLGNSTASSLPERHTLTFNAAAGTMTEAVEKPNATNPVTWKAPTTKILLAGITRDKDAAGNVIPIFQYRGFDNTKTPVQISTTTNLAVPLKANANAGKVAMVKITFRSVARRTPRSEVSFAIADDVYSRVINPNPPEQAPANFTPTPSCN